MRKIKVLLQSDNTEIEYNIDVENSTYKSLSRRRTGDTFAEEIAEEGELGDSERQQMIAKRIYYVLLTGMKHG